MAFPGILNFDQMVRGDMFLEWTFTPNFSLSGVRIDMWVCDAFTNKPIKKLSTDGEIGGIIISGSSFKISEFLLNLPVGEHLYDMQFTFPDSKPLTFIKGKFPIVDDHTK